MTDVLSFLAKHLIRSGFILHQKCEVGIQLFSQIPIVTIAFIDSSSFSLPICYVALLYAKLLQCWLTYGFLLYSINQSIHIRMGLFN